MRNLPKFNYIPYYRPGRYARLIFWDMKGVPVLCCNQDANLRVFLDQRSHFASVSELVSQRVGTLTSRDAEVLLFFYFLGWGNSGLSAPAVWADNASKSHHVPFRSLDISCQQWKPPQYRFWIRAVGWINVEQSSFRIWLRNFCWASHQSRLWDHPHAYAFHLWLHLPPSVSTALRQVCLFLFFFKQHFF